jgi:cell division protein FtsX
VQRNKLGGLIAALITGALVIVFAVFLIVRERTREIVVLKALGPPSWRVIGQLGAEVLGLSGIAAVVATGLLLRLAYEGRTVVLVTHDRHIARHADTRPSSLRDGRVSLVSVRAEEEGK